MNRLREEAAAFLRKDLLFSDLGLEEVVFRGGSYSSSF